MDELLEVLEDINPDIDYETEDQLVDGKVLDSLSIITLVSNIAEEFDIEIGPEWLVPEHWNSAQAIWNMIQAIQEDE